jgi:hypothetical protein
MTHHDGQEDHEGKKKVNKSLLRTSCPLCASWKIERVVGFRSVLVRLLDSVIPARSAGIQADMDVSGCILHTWIPAIHAGKTKLSIFMFVGERKLMKHFVVNSVPENLL